MAFDFYGLTAKQKKVYSAIESYIRMKGIPPTVREIGEMVGEKTPGAVQGILNRLEQKGVIKRETGMARSIQLVSGNFQYVTPVYIPEIKKITRRNLEDLLSIYNIARYHPLSPDIIPSCSDCFIVDYNSNILPESEMSKDSLILIRMGDSYADGDTVLAVFENHAVLRKYFSTDKSDIVKLEADNDLLKKETFSRDEVFIIGKLAGKIIRY